MAVEYLLDGDGALLLDGDGQPLIDSATPEPTDRVVASVGRGAHRLVDAMSGQPSAVLTGTRAGGAAQGDVT